MPAPALAVCAPAIAHTRQLARRLAAALSPPPPLPHRIYLSGALGAGKTAFAAALLAALGERGRVRSPTFALAHTYALAPAAGAAPLQAHHLDAYRLMGAPLGEDLQELLSAAALILLEWPERAADAPAPDLRLRFSQPAADHDSAREQQRDIAITAHSPHGHAVLARLQHLAAAPDTTNAAA